MASPVGDQPQWRSHTFRPGRGRREQALRAVGEDARPSAAQALNSLLGKMLRINKEPNSIPTDNPFCTQTTGKNGNLNTGAQEPLQLRCTARDGQDLHQRRRTEGLGGDQRWHPGCRLLVARLRGTYRYAPLRKKGKRRHKKRRGYYGYPLLRTYTHGSGCAITGGAFYNPPLDANSPFPDEYVGDYFFADFCGGVIARYDIATDTATSFASGPGEFPVDLKMGSEGDLFFLARNPGSFEKISYTPTP